MSTNAIRPARKSSTNPIFDYRPFIGFGSPDMVDPQCRFVFWRRDAAFIDWQVATDISTHRVPHSNRTIYQTHGSAAMTLETGLWFRSWREYQAFLSLSKSVGVLRMDRNFTMHAPSQIVTRLGHSYADFDNVVVTSITDQTFDNDGGVRCQVTFERAEGADSYYGYAYYADDDE